MTRSQHDIEALAPGGILRATINLGNPILARQVGRQPPIGVSVDLANALASRLAVQLVLVVVDSAAQAVDAVTNEQADVGFFAIDPVRGQGIEFTDPYVLIEGCYLVREDSNIRSNAEVDRRDVTVCTGIGSAYDLYLTRALQRAQIVRAPTSPTVVDTFLELQVDVAAGVRQQLETDAQTRGGLRLLPERFMVIQQAMGLPKKRGTLGRSMLQKFIGDMKASGFVHEALRRHGVDGASVAPTSG